MTTVRDIFQLACPRCGSDEHLKVAVVVWVDITPDGTVDNGWAAHEWWECSRCLCAACDHESSILEFTVKETPPEGTPRPPAKQAPVPTDVLCELAHALTVRECGSKQIPIDALDEDGDETIYTQDAQLVFDAIYEIVSDVLEPYREEVMP